MSSQEIIQAADMDDLKNDVLRPVNLPELTIEEINSPEVQELIARMEEFLASEGANTVGLAATQLGEQKNLAVIKMIPPEEIQKSRGIEPFEAVIINPSFEGIGEKLVVSPEGCLSTGTGDDGLMAMVERYPAIKASWLDKDGNPVEQILSGPAALVFQHETEHLEGIIITDKINPGSISTNSPEVVTSGDFKKMMGARAAADANPGTRPE